MRGASYTFSVAAPRVHALYGGMQFFRNSVETWIWNVLDFLKSLNAGLKEDITFSTSRFDEFSSIIISGLAFSFLVMPVDYRLRMFLWLVGGHCMPLHLSDRSIREQCLWILIVILNWLIIDFSLPVSSVLRMNYPTVVSPLVSCVMHYFGIVLPREITGTSVEYESGYRLVRILGLPLHLRLWAVITPEQ